MEVLFVTHKSDGLGLEVVRILERLGYPVRVLRKGESAPPGSVALFGPAEPWKLSWPNRHLRCAAHRLEGVTPQWVETTPFWVAVRKNQHGSLKEALKTLARAYREWYPGRSGRRAPWGQAPTSPENLQRFLEWKARAAVIAGHQVRLPTIVEAHLRVIFGGEEAIKRAQRAGGGRVTLAVMGCAPFNRSHCDVASRLEERKAEAARRAITNLVLDASPWLEKVVFVIAAGDFVTHPALKASLHPFFWPAVEEIEANLGRKFEDEEVRLWGRTGQRTDEEVAEALEAGFDLVVREIVEPVSQAVQVPVSVLRWTEICHPEELDAAWEIAQRRKDLAQKIYHDRVQAREWYATVDRALGREAGFRRTLGNNAVYIATVMWVARHPEVLIADVEVDDQFWRELKPVLAAIWGPNEPYIGSFPASVCQPWAY